MSLEGGIVGTSKSVVGGGAGLPGDGQSYLNYVAAEVLRGSAYNFFQEVRVARRQWGRSELHYAANVARHLNQCETVTLALEKCRAASLEAGLQAVNQEYV